MSTRKEEFDEDSLSFSSSLLITRHFQQKELSHILCCFMNKRRCFVAFSKFFLKNSSQNPIKIKQKETLLKNTELLVYSFIWQYWLLFDTIIFSSKMCTTRGGENCILWSSVTSFCLLHPFEFIQMANTTLSLDLLPVECLSQICSLLDHISLVQISLTCKQLWFVANNDKIWENRFKYDFKQFYIENSYPSEWKQQYLNRIKRSRPYWKQESSYLSTCT